MHFLLILANLEHALLELTNGHAVADAVVEAPTGMVRAFLYVVTVHRQGLS